MWIWLPMKLLLVDEATAGYVCQGRADLGHACDLATNGIDGLTTGLTKEYDAIVSGGYVNNEQRKRFSAPRGQASFYDHYRTNGYQVGGGVEYSLTDRYYVNAAYKYSQYNDHTARQRAMIRVRRTT